MCQPTTRPRQQKFYAQNNMKPERKEDNVSTIFHVLCAEYQGSEKPSENGLSCSTDVYKLDWRCSCKLFTEKAIFWSQTCCPKSSRKFSPALTTMQTLYDKAAGPGTATNTVVNAAKHLHPLLPIPSQPCD